MELRHLASAREHVHLRTEGSVRNDAIAIRDAALPSTADAERALAATLELLYRNYSAEGFSLIEHLLLRPQAGAGDPFLSLPEGETDA